MDKNLLLSVLSIGVYIMGGLAVFSGIVLIAVVRSRDIWGICEGMPLGYLLVCTGLALSGLGVLIMRILRNRP